MFVVLLAALVYVTYLYFFREQTPGPFQWRENCTANEIAKGTAKAKLFFERYANELSERNSIWKDQLRSKPRPWAIATEDVDREKHFYSQEKLAYLNDSILLCECLDQPTQLNAQLLQQHLETTIEGYIYRYCTYPVNVHNGLQDRLSNSLINECPINSIPEAQDYIARVERAKEQVERLIQQLKVRAEKNIILPRQLFPEVLSAIQRKLSSTAQKADSNHSIDTDFYDKIKKLNLSNEDQKELKAAFSKAFNSYWIPAYQQLYDYLRDLETQATEEIGVWRFEEGKDFYAYKLHEQTATTLTADEVFQLGKEEVNRIHQKIEKKLQKLKYDDNLAAFFSFLQTDEQFYYPNTPKGKMAYLNNVRKLITAFEPELKKLFSFDSNYKLLVNLGERTTYKIVETDSGTIAVYSVDLSKKGQRSNYQLVALTYANTIPGEHLQMTSERMLTDLPRFRQLIPSCRAYQKGWKLYATYLPQEIEGYEDTYADIGRLVNELWWTCALVVDIGIHCYEWNQEQAVLYYQKNTPNTRAKCLQMVHQQIINPAQAIAAKMSMLALLELRNKAQITLGKQFNIQDFHDVVLSNGAVPLGVLQDLVDDYIE